MIIPKDATPPARGEPDAFHTPKTLDTVLESPGSAFRRVPPFDFANVDQVLHGIPNHRIV